MSSNLQIVQRHIKKLVQEKQNQKLYDFMLIVAERLILECNILAKNKIVVPVTKPMSLAKSKMSLNKDSISLFHTISAKTNNDAHNIIREEILCNCFNNKIPSDWITTNSQWSSLKEQTMNFIDKLIQLSIKTPNIKSIKAEKKSGRNFNYDIHLKVLVEDNEHKEHNLEYKTEFKYNSENINKYPEFLSVACNNYVNKDSEEYASYFYDNYLNRVIELYRDKLEIEEDALIIPTKQDYLKYVYNMNYSKLKLFETMYTYQETVIEEKKELVDESIANYLSTFKLDITALNKKLKESQSNKVFMLYKSGVFNYDTISDDELTVTGVKEIKNKNTVITCTKNPKSFIHMLLRWKNRAGILYPAWQIKLVRVN